MIITLSKAAGFSQTLRAVTEKAGAVVLGHNLSCSTIEEQNAAMVAVAKLNRRVQKPMVYFVIRLSAGERLSASDWRKLTRQYLKGMGYTDNQYLLVRHTAPATHDQVHVVVNRVRRSSGKVVSLEGDYYQSRSLARELEATFNLRPVWGDLGPLKQRRRGDDGMLRVLPSEIEHRRMASQALRSMVNEGLLVSQDLDQFVDFLEARGVKVELKRERGKSEGITFSYDQERFSGSQLGTGYSLPKLRRAWEDAAVPESA